MGRTSIAYVIYSSEFADDSSLNAEASASAYATLVEAAFAERYPGAQVDVSVRHRVSGVGSGLFIDIEPFSMRGEDALNNACSAIAENIWERGEYWVESPACSCQACGCDEPATETDDNSEN